MTTIANSASAAFSSGTRPVFPVRGGGRRSDSRLSLGVCAAVIGGASLAAWAGMIYAASLFL